MVEIVDIKPPRPVTINDGMGNTSTGIELKRGGTMSYVHDIEDNYDVWVQTEALTDRG